MARLSTDTRRTILLIITALVVSYVRHLVQYARSPWASGLGTFLASWFLHYFVMLVVCFLVLVVSVKSDPFFFPDRPARTMNEEIHETIVNVCITPLMSSLFMWFTCLWPGNGDSYD